MENKNQNDQDLEYINWTKYINSLYDLFRKIDCENENVEQNNKKTTKND